MFSSRKGKGSGGTVAIIDIGSGSVGLAIADMNGQGPAQVLLAHRDLLPLEERTDEATITALISQLSTLCDKMLGAYASKLRKKASSIDAVYVIIRTPWTRTLTHHLETHMEKETRVTESLINDLARKAIAEVTDIDQKNMLEASVFRVQLNGYPTSEPHGQYAKDVGVSVLTSDCDPRVRNPVEEVIVKHFNKKPLVRSGTRAVLAILREHTGRRNYVILDMVSEATSITTVRKDAMSDRVVIPEGVRSLVRRITNKGLPEETFALLRMISKDQCDSEACKAVVDSLARIEPELVRIFGDAMSKIATSERLPNDLVLLTLPELAGWLAGFFGKLDFAQFTTSTQPFVVRTMNVEDLKDLIAVEAGIDIDMGLATCVALVHIEQK